MTAEPASVPDDVDAYIGLAAADLLHPSVAETALALVALARTMDNRGVLLRVDGDELEFVGPSLPAWCEPIVRYWWDLLVCAHAGRVTHRFVYCDHCYDVALLLPRRVGRACYTRSDCPGRLKTRLSIRFDARTSYITKTPIASATRWENEP